MKPLRSDAERPVRALPCETDAAGCGEGQALVNDYRVPGLRLFFDPLVVPNPANIRKVCRNRIELLETLRGRGINAAPIGHSGKLYTRNEGQLFVVGNSGLS